MSYCYFEVTLETTECLGKICHNRLLNHNLKGFDTLNRSLVFIEAIIFSSFQRKTQETKRQRFVIDVTGVTNEKRSEKDNKFVERDTTRIFLIDRYLLRIIKLLGVSFFGNILMGNLILYNLFDFYFIDIKV